MEREQVIKGIDEIKMTALIIIEIEFEVYVGFFMLFYLFLYMFEIFQRIYTLFRTDMYPVTENW